MTYNLTYQQHNQLKQAAYIMQKQYNQKLYRQPYNPNKQFITYKQAIAIINKKTKLQQLDILAQYQEYKYRQDNKKLIQYNKSIIIHKDLQNLNQEQINSIALNIQNLETIYQLDLDTNYQSNTSILLSYQQILAYKAAKIKPQLRRPELPQGQYYLDKLTDNQFNQLEEEHFDTIYNLNPQKGGN